MMIRLPDDLVRLYHCLDAVSRWYRTVWRGACMACSGKREDVQRGPDMLFNLDILFGCVGFQR